MPVLGGLWAPDLGLRDPGQGVGGTAAAGVATDEEDEGPPSPVWGPLGSSPVTCGGLSLALELPALLRQLRAAWRARRGGPRGPERGQAPDAWAPEGRAEVDEPERVAEEKTAQRTGNNDFILLLLLLLLLLLEVVVVVNQSMYVQVQSHHGNGLRTLLDNNINTLAVYRPGVLFPL